MSGIIPKEVQLPSRKGITGRLCSVPNVRKDFGARIVNGARELGYVPVVVKTDSDGRPSIVDIYEKGPNGHKKEHPVFRGAYAEDGGFAYDIELNDNRPGADKIFRDMFGLVDSSKGVNNG